MRWVTVNSGHRVPYTMFFFETFSGESAVRVSFVVCRCSVGQEFGFPDLVCAFHCSQLASTVGWREGKCPDQIDESRKRNLSRFSSMQYLYQYLYCIVYVLSRAKGKKIMSVRVTSACTAESMNHPPPPPPSLQLPSVRHYHAQKVPCLASLPTSTLISLWVKQSWILCRRQLGCCNAISTMTTTSVAGVLNLHCKQSIQHIEGGLIRDFFAAFQSARKFVKLGRWGFFNVLSQSFLFSGHEPIYFTENKEKTLRVSYDRDTHTIEYMN